MRSRWLAPDRTQVETARRRSRSIGDRVRDAFRGSNPSAPPSAPPDPPSPRPPPSDPSTPYEQNARKGFTPSCREEPCTVQSEPLDSREEPVAHRSPLPTEEPSTVQNEAPASREEKMVMPTREQLFKNIDPLHFLRYYNIKFVIDNSSSMNDKNKRTGRLKWEEASIALAALVPDCVERAKNGIELHFLHGEKSYPRVTSKEEARKIFKEVQLKSGTPLSSKLDEVLQDYLLRYKTEPCVEPVLIVVITDGIPSLVGCNTTEAEEAVMDCVAKAINQLQEAKEDTERHQMGIQFFQIGEDSKAKDFLDTLDFRLRKRRKISGGWDLIDRATFDEERGGMPGLTRKGIEKVLKGSVDKLVDVLDYGTPRDPCIESWWR